MASQEKVWTGNAGAKTQVWQYNPPVSVAAPTWELTVNGKTLSYKSTGASSDAITGMLALWRACQYPEFREIAASQASTSTPVPQGVGTNEQQQIYITGSPTGGTFTLSYNGATTAAIAYNASADDVRNALQQISSIGVGNVQVTGSGTSASPWVIEFVNSLAAIAGQPLISATSSLTGGTSPGLSIAELQKGVAANTSFTTTHFLLTGKPGVPFTVTSAIVGKQTPSVNVSITTPGVDNVNEVQSVYLSGTPTGGTFTLTFGANTTAGIAYNASAAAVQSALAALVSIGSGNVAVTGSGTIASPWFVSFIGALTGPQSLLTGNGSGITGANQVSVTEITHGAAFVNEIQKIGWDVLAAPDNITGISGTWTVTFEGSTTSALAWNIDAPTLQSALEALSTIGTGNISVTQTAAPATGSTATSNIFHITFQGALAGQNVPQATVNAFGPPGLSFTPISDSFVLGNDYSTIQNGSSAGQDEVQKITLTNSPSGGTFTLTFGANTTTAIAYNAPATGAGSVQAALGALASIGGTGNVGVTGSNGGPWTVTFQGTLADAAQALITGSGTSLTGDVVNIAETIHGNAGTSQVETVTLVNTASGSFTLSFNGQTTAAIAYNASAATIQTDLQALSSIGSGNVAVSGSFPSWIVTFQGTLATTPLPAMAGSAANLVGVIESAAFLPTILCAADGPNFWDNAKNWLQNEVPQAYLPSGPNVAAVAVVAGGALAANTYYYKVTATNTNGETTPGSEGSGTTSGGNLTLNITWNAIAHATGYKVYRGTVAGSENVLVATISNANQTFFADAGGTTSAASPPGANAAVGDDVYLTNSSVSILYNLPQDNIRINSWNEDASYTGRAGNSRWNGSASAGYWEYRPTQIKIGAPASGILPINVGQGFGAASPFTYIDTGTYQVSMVVSGTAVPTSTLPCLLWTGSNASSEIDLFKGTMGIAYYPDETAQVATIRQAYQKNVISDSTLTIGKGCATIPLLEKNGGDTLLSTTITTLNGKLGTLTQDNGGIGTMLDLEGATYYSRSTGAIAALKVAGTGVFDRSQDSRPLDIAAAPSLYSGASFLDPHGAAVLTGQSYLDLNLVECGVEDVTVVLGKNVTLRRTQN